MKKSIYFKEKDFKAFLEIFNDNIENKYNYIAALRLDSCCDFPDFSTEFAKFVGGGLYENFSVAYFQGFFEADKNVIFVKLPFSKDSGIAIINHPFKTTMDLINSDAIVCKGKCGVSELYNEKFIKGAVTNAFKAFCNHSHSSVNNVSMYYNPDYYLCNRLMAGVFDLVKYNSPEKVKKYIADLKSKVYGEEITFEELFIVVKNVTDVVREKQDRKIFLNWDFNCLLEEGVSVEYLCECLKDCIGFACDNSTKKSPYKYKGAIADIIDYINSNYYKDIRLKNLAEKYRLKPSYLSLLFKNVFECTFTEYITKLRMEKACELLKQTDYSINEIYEKVGYTDYYSFIKAFKKNIGVSPTVYRKNLL